MSEGKAPPDAPDGDREREREGQRERQRERANEQGSSAPASAAGMALRLDAALGDWPMIERSAMDWDDAADRVIARIDAGETGASAASVSDEYLLAPPLAQTPEEIQNSAALGKGEASRRASRPSFSDARSASGSEAGKMGQRSSEQRANRRPSPKNLAES